MAHVIDIGVVVVDAVGDGDGAGVVAGRVVDLGVRSDMQHLSLSRELQACGYLQSTLPVPGLG